MMDAPRYFDGPQLELAEAVANGSVAAMDAALRHGAQLDQPAREGVTPLMFALVRKQKQAVSELLKRGADPNRRAANGENGVTLAVRLVPSDLDYLKSVLEHGGDPNTLEPDGDPVLSTVIGQNNPEAIRVLGAARADLNALDRTRSPLIVKAAYIAHWKCVWTLVELNTNWSVDDKGVTVAWLAYSSQMKPDSPVYPWLLKTREFLISHGVVFPPPSPRLVNSQKRQGR